VKQKILAWLEANPVVVWVGALMFCALMIYAGESFSQWRHARAINHQDQQIQKQIDTDTKAAASSESNANTHRDEREAAEGRADLAEEQKQQAAANSNRTLDPVRKARQRYEETRRSSPADSPALSDEQLCAELAKRGIACR
jgi:biopolymer transport protein ExbB/TolQ